MNLEIKNMAIHDPQSDEGVGDSDEVRNAGDDYAGHNIYYCVTMVFNSFAALLL